MASYEQQQLASLIGLIFERKQQHYEVQKDMVIKCNQLQEKACQIKQLYNDIAEKDRIKNILTNPQAQFDDAQIELQKIIEEKVQKQQETENLLKNFLKAHEKKFDQNQPNQIKVNIINLIRNINFFKENEQVQVYKQNESNHVNQIISMISNKSNLCSSEFINKFKQIVNKYQFIFDDLKGVQIYKDGFQKPINFEDFSEFQMSQISKYSDIIHNGQQQNVEQSPQIKQFMKLVNQKQECLPNQIKEKIQKVYLSISPFLEGVDLTMPQNINYLLEYPFIKSNFYNSQQDLQIIALGDQSIQFTKTSQEDDYYNNIISTLFIDKNITYSVIFEVSYQNQDHFSFFIGLTTKGNTDHLYNEKLSFCIASKDLNNGYGIDCVKQGDKMRLRKNFKQFQFKINLSEGLVEVSDYPNSYNIIKLDENKKSTILEKSGLYQIGFSIRSKSDSIIIKQLNVSID
ncbi:hypothetical protein TTHERM_01046850 (macronuclear) [Tetrahymena thermophila SB210]|uniref:Zinc carboxypeptidase family protein n=1 Tax=Tetrahymena thermophila (strain SB210) TaxID=312017 RepID=Q23ML2_TETTS|nr:hypothetical protein TTHERM_01046850 [Tetrahymena thermophila SB210]EAR97754.2 hypothetical protein TTHERM_01046850 [Tetrahymena thermophila SB210]|eukprot:XP_001017999.2 hypothetical protein TTHERM_01046850 [Tetrahymena thermophila SB210]